jgi:hypothetical protein
VAQISLLVVNFTTGFIFSMAYLIMNVCGIHYLCLLLLFVVSSASDQYLSFKFGIHEPRLSFLRNFSFRPLISCMCAFAVVGRHQSFGRDVARNLRLSSALQPRRRSAEASHHFLPKHHPRVRPNPFLLLRVPL